MAVAPEVFDAILAELTAGTALRTILKARKINPATFYPMLDADEERAKQYARASLAGCDAMADVAMAIADEPCKDQVAAARNRLRVDTRKWWLSKRHPRKYGERMLVGSDPDNPIPPLVVIGSGKPPSGSDGGSANSSD